MQELTVCVFSKEQPNFGQLSRYGIYYDKTLMTFDGHEIPLPDGEVQYSWRPHGLQVRIHTTLEAQPLTGIISPEQAANLGLPDEQHRIIGNGTLYDLLHQYPRIRFIAPTFPWDVLEFSRGEKLHATYFNARFNQHQSKYVGAVKDIGRVSNFIANKYNGFWKLGSDVSTLMRAALRTGTKEFIPDLTLVENTK